MTGQAIGLAVLAAGGYGLWRLVVGAIRSDRESKASWAAYQHLVMREKVEHEVLPERGWQLWNHGPDCSTCARARRADPGERIREELRGRRAR